MKKLKEKIVKILLKNYGEHQDCNCEYPKIGCEEAGTEINDAEDVADNLIRLFKKYGI